jgi:hypothetical protein
LSLSNELADGRHGIVGSLLQPGIWLSNGGISEDQLIVVWVLNGVVNIGPTSGEQPLPGVLMVFRSVTNPPRDLSQRSLG